MMLIVIIRNLVDDYFVVDVDENDGDKVRDIIDAEFDDD